MLSTAGRSRRHSTGASRTRAGAQPAKGLPGAAAELATRFTLGFSRATPATVGLEEELILLDPTSLEPVGVIDAILAVLGPDTRFKTELRAAQVELVTPVCQSVDEACAELSHARATLVERLDGRVRLLAAGTHPASVAPVAFTDRPRYAALTAANPWFARCGIPSALHVHVAIGDADEALAVYNAARSYLPEIAALAANSPFFEGRDTGLASSRLKLCEDSPRASVPPAFASWGELAVFVEWGTRGHLFDDLGDLWWDLRPRPDYGTVEFRIADCQTDVASSGCIAALCQALVVALQARVRKGEHLPVHATHVISENRWRALRDGLDGDLVDPASGLVEPTRDRIARMLDELDPYARRLGCSEHLAHAEVVLNRGGGAQRQRAVVVDRGVRGLLEWLADTTERVEPAVPGALATATTRGAHASADESPRRAPRRRDTPPTRQVDTARPAAAEADLSVAAWPGSGLLEAGVQRA